MDGSIEVDASVEEDGRYDIVAVLVSVSLVMCGGLGLNVVGWSGVELPDENRMLGDGENCECLLRQDFRTFDGCPGGVMPAAVDGE